MLTPAFTEAFPLFGRCVSWIGQGGWSTLTRSFLFAAVFLGFSIITSLEANILGSSNDNSSEIFWVSVLIGGPLIVAPLLFLFKIFPMGILKTLSGYASLMKKGRVQELDGTVADKSILDGVRGKLKEVLCEAAPQSLLQLCC